MALAEQILHNIRTIRELATAKGVTLQGHVLNAIEFVALAQFDLSILLSDLVMHQPGFRAVHYARFIVLLIHESSLSLQRVVGVEFREELAKTLNDSTVRDSLKSAHSSLHRVFDDCNRRFGKIRNGIVGHIDTDPDVRSQLLSSADVDAIAALAVPYLDALMRVEQYIPQYTALLTKRLAS